MPLCTLRTNLACCAIPDDFHVQLAQLIATTLNKSLERVTVIIQPDLKMFRNGNTSPGAWLSIWSMNVFGDTEKDRKMGKILQEFIAEHLGLTGDRLGITFHDLKPEELVWPIFH